MKQNSVRTISVSIIFIYFSFLTGCAGNSPDSANTSPEDTTTQSRSGIEGAWELVWSSVNGKVDTVTKPLQLKLFSDGFFCLIMKDSSGKWEVGSGGTYELEGQTYKETHKYSTVAEFIGATDWQEYELKGDTLYKKLFTKVVNAKGEDITSQFPKIEEKRVRASK